MYLDDKLKMALNILQTRIVSDCKSGNVLLIFDTEDRLDLYKKKRKYMCPDQILITIQDLYNPHSLIGRRIKRYWFMRDEDFIIKTERRNEK